MAENEPRLLMIDNKIDWRRVVWLLHASRAMDELEETRLVPERKMFYQFSARGHDLAQIILGLQLANPDDAICGYYRSRPILLTLGVSLDDALGSSMAREGGYSDGRDIGAVFNFPNPKGPVALPMCGGVGAQYTPTAGWAQALLYRHDLLGETQCGDAIAVALGGDGSVATNGFWSALTIATTQRLPMLFYIEDNGYGISVPSVHQTPGGNIAANLQSFQGLKVFSGDGTDAAEALDRCAEAVRFVRARKGPALLRLTVPRLSGHSFQDTQTYKSADYVQAERARDPLPKLKTHLVPAFLSEAQWLEIAGDARAAVDAAVLTAERRPVADLGRTARHVFFEGELQAKGGCASGRALLHDAHDAAQPEAQRINMVTAIRRTLEHELSVNKQVLLFGEDIGPKGGVHAVTLGLQDKFGERRVFDTSLSEEGIIGRAVGMAIAGLMPVAEIQFRKYADPAAEQLSDCGTMRWRTNNRFAAPMVVRMPIGFFKCGDPWHSQTNEVQYVHSPGWRVAVPSNAEDAVGLLRTSLRGNDPVIFFEHRAMLDAASARRPYPGDRFVLPFGKARVVQQGDDITIITWGAMVERSEQAAQGRSVEILDLRTLVPWDSDAVLASVRRTRRALIVHEDLITGGFGGEIAAVIAEKAFFDLDAPVTRLAMPDIPSPHNPELLEWALPTVEKIEAKIDELLGY